MKKFASLMVAAVLALCKQFYCSLCLLVLWIPFLFSAYKVAAWQLGSQYNRKQNSCSKFASLMVAAVLALSVMAGCSQKMSGTWLHGSLAHNTIASKIRVLKNTFMRFI